MGDRLAVALQPHGVPRLGEVTPSPSALLLYGLDRRSPMAVRDATVAGHQPKLYDPAVRYTVVVRFLSILTAGVPRTSPVRGLHA